MLPDSFSTMTASSIRIGCATASCTPAKKFVSTGRAARPATMPATPAEANSVTPECIERHQRKADGDEHDHHVHHPLEHANLRDVLARQQIVLDVEPKAH